MPGIMGGSVAGAAGVYYSRPVYSLDGTASLGPVVCRIRAEPIARILSGAGIDDDERKGLLVDGDGVIVWHPDPGLMYKSLMPLDKGKIAEIVADQRFRRATVESIRQPELANLMVGARERGHVAYKSTVTGREEIAGVAPVPGIDWVVGVTESRDYFAAPLDRLFEKVIVSVLLAGADFVALAPLLPRSLPRPLRDLPRAVHSPQN